MTNYPTPSDYQEALQFPETAFLDPVLAAGTPVAGALGLPQPITGAFAAVFPVDTPGGRFAVRCFLTKVDDQASRYRAVARHLAETDLPNTVEFDYQPEGIRVGGTTYPVLKMAWAEGEGLAAFVERHRYDARILRELAEAWRTLLTDLEAAGVAHGDLQHGNVLVQETDGAIRLVLVDYDTLFVPALAGKTSAEVGHRNYQHPDRTETDFDGALDHFPGLVVYTALRALEAQPDLWTEFSTGENLLFQAGDFYNPQSSPLFTALRQIDDARPLAEALATACYLEPGAVPSLAQVLSGDSSRTANRRSRTSKRREQPSRSASRSGFESWALSAFVVALVGVIGIGLATEWKGAVIASIVVGVAGAWQVQRGYRAQSVVRRRRRTEREAAVLAQWIADLEDTRRGLASERRQFLERLDVFRAERLAEVQDAALEEHLRHHFVGELDNVEGVGHRAVVRLKAVGIRNAFHASPERVAEARGITSESRHLIAAWRDHLAAEAAADVPEDLSPAEEQRLNRQIERRLQSLDAESARVAAKAEVQRGELARVRAQHEALPTLTLSRYVLFLLRLRPLPQASSERTAPILQQPGTDRQSSERSHSPKPVADGAWWEQV